jgi:hypothetical protein
MPFQYTQWQNPYVGTIGELMQAGPAARARAAIAIGNAQAQGALQSGQAWAGAIQTVGQAAAGIPGQIVQGRQQEQAAQIRDLQLTEAQRAATAADRLEATRRQVNGFMNDPDVINPDGTFNLEGMAKKAGGPLPNGASGPTEAPDRLAIAGLLEPINAQILQARESQRVYAEHQTNALARLASGVLELGKPTEANPSGSYLPYATVAVASAVKGGLMTDAQGAQYLAQVVENPELALKSAAARSTVAPIKLGKDDRLVDPNDPTRTLVPAQPDPADAFKGSYTGPDGIRRKADGTPVTGEVMRPQAPATPKSTEMFDALLDGKRTKLLRDPAPGGKVTDLSGNPIENPATRVQAITPASVIIHNDAAAARNGLADKLPAWALDDSRPAGPDGNTLDRQIMRTPNGLYQDAVTLIQTGKYPQQARGSDQLATLQRAALDAKVGAISASSGMDVPQLRAFFDANKASLTAQQKVFDTAAGNIATADRNAALLAKALEKMPEAGSPILDQPLRAFTTKVVGDPVMSPIATYLASVQSEYGKLINSASGGASVLSDSARHEAQALIDPNATVAQMLASVEALKTEGGNRLLSIGEQIKTIQGRMTLGAAPGAGPGAARAVTVYTPSGKPYTFPTQADADRAVASAKAAGLWK